jgi:hypothetical protein
LIDSQANLDVQASEVPGTDLKAESAAPLNLIPAAADATKKESKIRNISTKWTDPAIKANSKQPAEAK